MLSHNNRIIVFHISDTYKLMAVMRIMNKEKEMQESGNAPPLFFPTSWNFILYSRELDEVEEDGLEIKRLNS